MQETNVTILRKWNTNVELIKRQYVSQCTSVSQRNVHQGSLLRYIYYVFVSLELVPTHIVGDALSLHQVKQYILHWTKFIEKGINTIPHTSNK